MQYALDQEAVLVHIDEIVIGRNVKNIRKHFPEGSVKELALSIFEGGLISPIMVWETDDPTETDAAGDPLEITELICGARRMRAIRYLLDNLDDEWTCDTSDNPQLGMISARQFSGTLEDAEILNGVENIEREEVDVVDAAEWLFGLVDSGVWTQARLAAKLNKSAQWVSSRITLHRKGSDNLKDALREDFLKSADNPQGGALLAFSTAYTLASKLSHEEQDKAIKKALLNNEKLTLEQAEREGDDNKSQKPSKKKRADILAKAIANAATDPGKFGNAHGVAMALRWVDGTLGDDEIEEVINWDTSRTPHKPKAEQEEEAATDPPEEIVDACEACGGDLADGVEVCPGCGHSSSSEEESDDDDGDDSEGAEEREDYAGKNRGELRELMKAHPEITGSSKLGASQLRKVLVEIDAGRKDEYTGLTATDLKAALAEAA